jgi:hypothetical protein
VVVLLTFFLFGSNFCSAADSSLAIIEAGVQQSEDAPFVSGSYQFLPGDYLHFTFQIAGFAVKSEERNEIRKISLEYEVVPEDSNGIALALPSSDAIQTELSTEDKNWTPKRRASFLIPSFVGAGEFRVHVRVKDLVAKTETSKNFPFRIGGMQVPPSNSVIVENLRFFRSEDAREALEVPAYNAGDTIYARFNMLGFKTAAQNEYHLSYGITVLRPNGKPFLEAPKAAELAANSFYPAQYVPGVINVKTSPDTARGEYIIILAVHDLIGNTNFEIKKAFTVE